MAVLGRGSTSLMSRPRADLPLRLITASSVNQAGPMFPGIRAGNRPPGRRDSPEKTTETELPSPSVTYLGVADRGGAVHALEFLERRSGHPASRRGRRRRRLQRQQLIDPRHVVDLDRAPQLLAQVLVDIPLVPRGRMTPASPQRCAASSFSSMPPTGSTWPDSAPVIATSPRTTRPVNRRHHHGRQS